MKKKTKIKLAATTLMALSLTIITPQTMPQKQPQQPEDRPVSVLVDDSRGNTPPPSVEHQISKTLLSQNGQNGTLSQPTDSLIAEQIVIPSDNSPPQPSEKEEVPNTPTPTTQTATKPTTPPAPISAEPKMGDTRIIDGKKQSYFLGFGWVDGMGENKCTFAADMYENGNKIGSMGGGTVGHSDTQGADSGDINKMVGIMD